MTMLEGDALPLVVISYPPPTRFPVVQATVIEPVLGAVLLTFVEEPVVITVLAVPEDPVAPVAPAAPVAPVAPVSPFGPISDVPLAGHPLAVFGPQSLLLVVSR